MGFVLQTAVVSAAPDTIKVNFDGAPTQFETDPIEKDGVVAVPMKGVFERLGAVVNFDHITQTVKALRGKTVIVLKIGSPVALINLKQHPLQLPPFVQDGNVMVPLRFVSEAMGAEVEYDEKARLVSIRTTSEPTITLPTVHVSGAGTPTPSPVTSPTPAGARISEFRHDATATLHPGDVLNVTLIGSPKASASFSIPGVADKVPLAEGAPGTYTAAYKVPDVTVKQVPVYGVLALGDDRAPLATATVPITIQPRVPHIERPEPAPGSTVSDKTPRIAGFFDMVGQTLEVGSIHIRVNGTDVTKDAYVTHEFFTYTPHQPISGHVKVEVSGRASAASSPPRDWSDSWEFDLSNGPVKIASATHGPTSVYKAGDVIEVTMLGTAGGTASFDIGTYRRGVTMHESSAGTYAGTYRVDRKDHAEAATIGVHLRVGKDETAAQVPIPVTLGVGVSGDNAMALTVTSPQPDEQIGSHFTIRGQAAAGAKVHVDVLSHVPVVNHDVRVAQQDAIADPTGAYTMDIELPIMVGGVNFTLVVTAADSSGQTAGPVEVPVIGK